VTQDNDRYLSLGALSRAEKSTITLPGKLIFAAKNEVIMYSVVYRLCTRHDWLSSHYV
jgi:hypothetical protein